MNILIVLRAQKDNRESSKVTSAHLQKIKKTLKGSKVKVLEQDSKNLANEFKKADILITSAIDLVNLENAPNLKWIHLTSAGANRIPKEILESDIIVTNSSGVHPIPISEHVFGLMLMLSRGLNQAYKTQILKKKWFRDGNLYTHQELAGKNLLVVGMGRIGERIAKLGEAFEMNIKGIVRNPKKHQGKISVYRLDKLESLLKESDFIVNALPLTSETKKLFNKKIFSKFKKGSYFINIGRGDTVVERDLVEALKNGKLKGASLDVFEVEPLPNSSPLWNLDNVIITPHYSGWTPYYLDRVIDIFCQNLHGYLSKKALPNLIDKKLGY